MSVQLEMANAMNGRDLSAVTRTPHHLEATSLLNRRLKLPPISPNANLIQNNSSVPLQQQQHFTAFANSINLPRLDMCSLGLQHYGNTNEQDNTRNSKDIDNSIFSFPRVYSVLPPIGKKLTPAAPSVSYEDTQSSNCTRESSKSGISSTKRPVRRHRIKRQTMEKTENVSETTDVYNNCQNNSVIQSEDRPKQGPNEGFAIHISDTCLPADKAAHSSTVKEEERSEVTSNPDEDSKDVVKIDHVPEELRPYADLYPPSPPPTDRRGRNFVLKKRQEIEEENRIRMTFLKESGRNRRNATCGELDDVLKNAVELLRELFLRKTMEELCMLW